MKKTCSRCKKEKNTSDFRKDRTRLDGLRYQCKTCSRTQARSTYTTKYYKKYRPKQNQRIERNIVGINAYKSTGCVYCFEKELVCLDLHHPEPGHKDFAIATARTFKWERIEQELKKCMVVCRNCHAKLHAGLIKA